MREAFAFARLRRSFAFARHIPPRRLARRLTLTLRRACRDRLGWRGRTAIPSMSPAPPTPIFPARSGMIAQTPAGVVFTFLGEAHLMSANRIDWRAPSPAPEHQLWRMNLHYMEYLEEIDDASFVTLVDDWIGANPPGGRGAWKDSWNAYALSLRVVVWMQQLASRGEAVPEEARSHFAISLAEQLDFLERNLETDIGGNHLIKNIKALIWGSAFFAGPGATRWRRLGLDLLRDALPEQILADGVHYERSPAYHNQVFADLLECRQALGEAGAPSELDRALRSMAVATADLAHPDGDIAQFNDAGLSMAYRPGECFDAFEALFGDCPAPRASFALEAAGYFGWRSREDYFIADCGRIGPDALPAHAHGDILSFEWSVAGVRIIVDPGVYEYVDGPRRRAARSASTHNTLSIEGLDQAEFFGAFRCGRRPNVSMRRCEHDAESLVLEGTHDGFGREASHVRRFEVDKQGLRIVDRIEAPVGRKARIGFLLHPEVCVVRSGEGWKSNSIVMTGLVPVIHVDPPLDGPRSRRVRAFSARGSRDDLDDRDKPGHDGGSLLFLSRARARIEVRSSATLAVEDAVWWPDMGHEVATKRLSIDWDKGSAEIVTTFALRTDGE